MKVAELKKLEKALGAFVEEFASKLGQAERRYWCKLFLGIELKLRPAKNSECGKKVCKYSHFLALDDG